MLGVVRGTNSGLSNAEMDAVVDPRVRAGIRIGDQMVRTSSGRHLTGGREQRMVFLIVR
jgi:hypothetical protein